MFATTAGWDHGLDDAQLEIATQGDEPLIVMAGAGTGKTRALVCRLACLLERGVPPARILLLTFTRRAAEDMLARAADLAGRRGHQRPEGGTFHSVAHRHVVAYAEVLDLPKTFGVLDPVVRQAPDDPLARWADIAATAPPATRTELSESRAALFKAREQSAPGDRAGAVVGALSPLLRRRYRDSAVRLEDLDRLAGAASVAEDFSGWVADLTLDPPVSTSDYAGPPHLDEDYVVISTIHSAKGLEWPVVHLPQLVDGAMPLDMSLTTPAGLEEEQRLLYVAVTRAQDELYLYAPHRMPHHRRGRDDRHSLAPISRFLDADVRRMLEVVEESPAKAAIPGSAGSKVAVDLDPLWA